MQLLCWPVLAPLLTHRQTKGHLTPSLQLPAPSRFLALGLTSVWWMTPAWGSCASWVPLETQFLLLELPEGAGCAVLLPLLSNHGTFRASLAGSGPGSEDPALHLHVDSGDAGVMTQTWTDVFYIAAGKEVYPLVDAAVATAGRLSGGARPRTSKAVPDFVDTFGWCTWDAFYYDVTPAGVRIAPDCCIVCVRHAGRAPGTVTSPPLPH